MDLIISNSDGRPIYEQITSQIKALILSGDLKPGEKLPSIRALANGLRISVITTKRAYTDLESQGFIETVQGRGSFVAGGNMELLREEKRRQIERRLAQVAADARAAGITDSELREMLDLTLEGDSQS
ncbi:GntR family transcriptional regulator [Bifidobacterium vespertilionis]|uniref:GntR family transcriptional regulator n=1 Tax=Bifidobacterium vespertilionis TaxID=2562524 RepID=UPI001BDD3764|nr:GntR family transcriptional regulator [Bifidobacterium vespertilionis]MBT1179180.1 GntR family transcriptional regulator [Bifidobacterium vespertilionis]